MNSSEFEAVVADALAALPEWVREAMQNIKVLVEDEAGEHLDPDGEGLLGLYTGVPLTERESGNAGELPDVIYLFRIPHLEMGLPAEALREEIAKTLIHEIAHYFGIDDDHLEDIGWG
ncbi:MAG: metallopeptidase family protein [Gammaproteobacteria bacterium]|nr:metallopeptidase family protein [Gammaproteobacteria bacterium]MDH4315197.1 metallopeptidase family protein [Gammaproteobacteria bacterium]MDH5501640.1 metallopeptidase family protein [Gammaproteobacteria bacterium]